jgi:hypothetical protein
VSAKYIKKVTAVGKPKPDEERVNANLISIHIQIFLDLCG